MRTFFFFTLVLLAPLAAIDKSAAPTFENVLKSLEQAISKNPDKGSLRFGQFFHFNSKLQQEVAEQFKKDHPKLWKAAMNSSGNLHNPKVIPLRSKFPETLRRTPTVQKIETRLNQSGYTLGKISFEKLFFAKKDGNLKIYSIIYPLPFSRIKVPSPEKVTKS